MKQKLSFPAAALALAICVTCAPLDAAQPAPKSGADITQWLREAIAAGGIVIVPPGEYVISGPVKLGSHSGLRGPATLRIEFEGIAPTEKNAFGGDNAAFLASGKDISFEDLTIAKKFVDGSYGIGIMSTGGSADITIRNVEISGYSARYGIHLIETAGFEISGCHVHSFMVNTAADMILDSPAGIRISRSHHGVVSDNRIVNIEVGDVGMQSISPVRPSYGEQSYQSDNITMMECKDVTVVGNVMETSGEGLDILLCSRITVVGNTISNQWNEGVKALGVSQSVIANNMISNATVGIGLRRHMGINYECWDNSITGNTILYTKPVFGLSSPGRSRRELRHLAGIDIEKANYLTITGNTISDVQEKPLMAEGIRGDCPECVSENNFIRGKRAN